MSAVRLDAIDMPPGKPLTGLKVLVWLVGFFGIVASANGLMIHYAVSTFRGLEEKNAYTAGLAYNRQIAAEKAQDARGWTVDFTLRRTAAGQSEISVLQKDAQGVASNALRARVVFEHPADSHRDIEAKLDDYGSGVFRQKLAVAPGAWDVVIEMKQGGEQVFRSRNRVMIADAPAR